jgi:ATP-dependent exoDNAse (exonuclease V) alpha subunit
VLCAEVCVGRRQQLVELPGDYDANMENYTEKNKLRTDRRPVPCPVTIRKGLRIHLTRNLDKAGDFVNGMECEVKSWDETHRCLQVETITGKQLAVYQYTDPDPKAQNVSFFPIRLGYASTIYKMQGAELEHVTIYLDLPGQRAAAYVAMSRVKRDENYFFGGKYSRNHFVPNA